MCNHLPGEFVKQIRMLVITNVIESNQSPDKVIFRPGFFDHAGAILQLEAPVFMQMLDQNILRHWLEIDAAAIKIELFVTVQIAE